MKNILIILLLILSSCNDEYKHIGQEIIDGKISSIEPGFGAGLRGVDKLPVIYVQTNKTTKAVSIPFEYENRWRVGDSCLLIIEKYEKIK